MRKTSFYLLVGTKRFKALTNTSSILYIIGMNICRIVKSEKGMMMHRMGFAVCGAFEMRMFMRMQ